MTQRRQGPRSRTRLQDREVVKKVIPAIKILSQHMHNTNPKAEESTLIGYKIPAGDFTDSHGVHWQVQVHAVKAKSQIIKNNEIIPIINKWAIAFKLRLLSSSIIEKIFGDEIIK